MASDLESDQAACLVMTTLPNAQSAAELARELVQTGMAACVQMLPIQSFYMWKGQACEEPECLLLIKTRCSLFAEVERFIRHRHSYEVPEILQLPISAGSLPYLDWLVAQTRETNDKG